jgi:hypothetical protein
MPRGRSINKLPFVILADPNDQTSEVIAQYCGGCKTHRPVSAFYASRIIWRRGFCTRRFVDFMAAQYTVRALSTSRSLSSDYIPAGAQKRLRQTKLSLLEAKLLLQRELGIEESYRVNLS